MGVKIMKKVIFIGNWGESPTDMLKRYSNQTPGNSGIWEDIQGVDNPMEADYCVVMDGVDDELLPRLDWSKVIYFQREPDTVKPHYLGHMFPQDIFFKGTYEHFHNVPTWWINLSFDELVELPYPSKTKKISTVTSGKRGLEERSKRLDFLQRFVNEYKNIDVYGRAGTQSIVGDCWKGELNYDGNCKFKGHIDYEYSIVLENVLYPNSWTEKPCDSILSWAFPIYSGASNFGEYFPLESFYQLDTMYSNISDIIEFISEPPTKLQIESLAEARNLLLHKWNIWPSVKRIIDERS
tara:strand:- start:2836 stop:3720 length:885 start_codon:yes stop_codon:yes gene_type:complete